MEVGQPRTETSEDDDRFFGLGLTIVHRIVKRKYKSWFNVFAEHSPAACAAFLAGFAVVHKKRRLFSEALDSIGYPLGSREIFTVNRFNPPFPALRSRK
jgi:hypothetical protein